MNDKTDDVAAIVAVIYLIGALLAFGHSAANNKTCEDAIQKSMVCNMVGGAVAGMLWPFYWTWVGFDALKRGDV